MSEHRIELPAVRGMPTAEDLLRWQELIQQSERPLGPNHKLVGIRQVEGGTIMGIIAKSSPS